MKFDYALSKTYLLVKGELILQSLDERWRSDEATLILTVALRVLLGMILAAQSYGRGWWWSK